MLLLQVKLLPSLDVRHHEGVGRVNELESFKNSSIVDNIYESERELETKRDGATGAEVPVMDEDGDGAGGVHERHKHLAHYSRHMDMAKHGVEDHLVNIATFKPLDEYAWERNRRNELEMGMGRAKKRINGVMDISYADRGVVESRQRRIRDKDHVGKSIFGGN